MSVADHRKPYWNKKNVDIGKETGGSAGRWRSPGSSPASVSVPQHHQTSCLPPLPQMRKPRPQEGKGLSQGFFAIGWQPGVQNLDSWSWSLSLHPAPNPQGDPQLEQQPAPSTRRPEPLVFVCLTLLHLCVFASSFKKGSGFRKTNSTCII